MNEHAMKPSRDANVFVRPCGALLLALMLASCGGGGGGDSPPVVTPPPPPAATQSLTLTGDASQVLAGGKTVTLTATPAVAATVNWSIDQGPGALSASSGTSVTYTPPAGGVVANTSVVIKASAGDASKTYRVTVYPDPGAPGLSLIAGTLGSGSGGDVDGKGTAARFGSIRDFAADPAGNLLVIDSSQGRLRKVSASGEVSTIDLPISSLQSLLSVSVAPDNTTYLLAGTTAGALVMKLMQDSSVAPFLTIAQTDQSIRKIVAGPSGVYLIGERHISTVGADGSAGISVGNGADTTSPCRDGGAAVARFSFIKDAAADAAGNLIIQDCYSVRKVTPAGVVTTIAGDLADSGAPKDGAGAAAHFANDKASVAVDKSGNILELDLQAPVYIGDNPPPDSTYNYTTAYRLRKVSMDGVATTLINGTTPFYNLPSGQPFAAATPPQLVRYLPNGTAVVARDAALFTLGDDGALTAFAGDEGDIVSETVGTTATARFINPRSISADLAGNLYVLDDVKFGLATAYKITPAGQVTRILHSTTLNQPGEIIAAPDGTIYITQIYRTGTYPRYSIGGTPIYKLSPDGTLQPFAGSAALMTPASPIIDGQGAAATFFQVSPRGFDSDGNLYVADSSNGVLIYRKITPQGLVSTVGALPAGVGVAPDGYRYGVDLGRGLIVRVDADGKLTTVAGTPDRNVNIVGPLPGSLIQYPIYLGSATGLAVTPTGPGSFAIVSGGAIIRLVLPH
jgi:hypothetical protein